MTTRHETIAAALVAAASSATSAGVIREEILPVKCPINGLINVRFNDPEEEEQELGSLRRTWVRVAEIEIIVQSAIQADRIVKLDTILGEIGVAFLSENLAGTVDHLEISAPVEAEDMPMDGAASLKGSIVEITLFYQTSNNPMEIQS